MQDLLLDLTGSVSNAPLTFNILHPGDQDFVAQTRIKDYHQNEWGAFFKDDWKIRPDLTLNLGVRYDWYGVPWESNGMHALPVGGAAGLFWITAGAPTQLQLVWEKFSPPNNLFFLKNHKKFPPPICFSLAFSWGGKKEKSVLARHRT